MVDVMGRKLKPLRPGDREEWEAPRVTDDQCPVCGEYLDKDENRHCTGCLDEM